MKRMIKIFIIVGVFVIAAAVLSFLKPVRSTFIYEDMEMISQEEYEGIFISMYSVEEYSEADFSMFRGVKTIITSGLVSGFAELKEYMEAVFATANNMTNVYFGIDPVKLWDSSKQNEKTWNKGMREAFLTFIEANPHITFEIMLPYSGLDYWVDMTAKEREQAWSAYSNFVASLEGYSNVLVYFMGAEQWLISNPGNYEEEGKVNPVVAQKLMLFTFCDHQYQISCANLNEVYGKLTALVEAKDQHPATYPDLSEWTLVFWGDSVIGNYKGSFSVTGAVNGLSGAQVYNYAIGGTQATDRADYQVSFPDMVNLLKTRDMGLSREETQLPYEVLENEGNKVCFLVHYGLNDYFNGVAVENPSDLFDAETFAGAVKTGVQELKTNFPKATIILMTPPSCGAFSSGTDINSKVGGLLVDYVAAIQKISQEMDVICMNNYVDLGITEENRDDYMADGIHLNEQGRYVLAQQIVRVLEQIDK